MAGFRFLEHTSDVYIEARGSSLEEALIQAAYALFDTMTDLKTIDPDEKRKIRVEAEDLDSLLFEWINEFLYFFDTEGLLFSKFEIEVNKEGDKYKMTCECWGEEFNPEKHPSRTEIKAPTYSLMEIIQEPSEVILRFVVDI
ncbi:MAG: archease [Candidatus Helarchaeota archaeon]|nr:archease [Candidatus Helarchaeota archaeon]